MANRNILQGRVNMSQNYGNLRKDEMVVRLCAIERDLKGKDIEIPEEPMLTSMANFHRQNRPCVYPYVCRITINFQTKG